jgi:hypothetical protein
MVMFRRRQEKKYIFILAFPILLILIILCAYLLRNKFSETSRVNADILVVEGWLPPSEFRLVADEFRKGSYKLIVTTGLKSTADYFEIYSNGHLAFKVRGKFSFDTVMRAHNISVNAFSSMGEINSSHFNFLVNDSVAGSFYATKSKKNYTVRWEGRLSGIDSISVQLLNYGIDSLWERKLFIRKIVIDNKISIPYGNNSVFSFPGYGKIVRIENKSESYAGFARQNLIALGIDSTLIIDVPAEKVSINRTLAGTLAFSNWLRSSSHKITGINIVTIGVHAPRTLMTYKHLLHEKYSIGVISLPDYRARNSVIYGTFRTLRELFEIAYYRIVLLFYP